MKFIGEFEYSNDSTAKNSKQEAIENECIEDSCIQKEEIKLTNNKIKINVQLSAPATMFDSSCVIIEILSFEAKSGYVIAEYDSGEGEEYINKIKYLPGGKEEEIENDDVNFN